MTPIARERYSRQVRFAGLGETGQQRLINAKVAIIGCGALGSFQANALARAGIGHLVLIDRDFVELSNLQRQWLFDEADATAETPKAVASARSLAAINSDCLVTPHVTDLCPSNIEDLLEGVQVILDGTDNFETRYLINDYSVRYGVPWIYGGAVGSYGISMPIVPGETACFRCVYPQAPTGVQPTCETAGVLNSVTAIVAAWQTTEAIKLLSGQAPVSGRITTVDVWTARIRQIDQPAPQSDCPTCVRREFPHLEGSSRAPISLCGRNAVQIHERAHAIDLERLRAQLEPLGQVRVNDFALRFFLPPYELTVFPDGRAIVKGTTEVGVARSFYAKYVGN